MDRERKLRQQRDAMRRLRFQRPLRLWPDEHIRATGPKVRLSCQMLEEYGQLHGPYLYGLTMPRGDW